MKMYAEFTLARVFLSNNFPYNFFDLTILQNEIVQSLKKYADLKKTMYLILILFFYLLFSDLVKNCYRLYLYDIRIICFLYDQYL